MQLRTYTVGPDGKRRILARTETYAPTQLPPHTTVEMPCHCPLHTGGQQLYPERARGLAPSNPVVVNRTADDLGGQGRSGGLS
jgi:hypothetical protein